MASARSGSCGRCCRWWTGRCRTPLGANPLVVRAAALGLEIAYMTYAISQFSGLSLWECLSRVIVVLTVGYALLIGIVGGSRRERAAAARHLSAQCLSAGVAD